MANSCAAQVQLCGVRVAELDGAGVPVPGSDTLYVTDQVARLTLAPNIRAGDEIEEPNACGEICVSFRSADQEKWWDWTLDLCVPDPELLELFGVGALMTVGSDTRGFRTRALRNADIADGVSVEMWTKRIINGVQDGTFPYWRWMTPLVKNIRFAGEVVMENGNLGVRLQGEAHENENIFDGPANDWTTIADEEPDRAWQYAQDVSIPTAQCGYQTLAAS